MYIEPNGILRTLLVTTSLSAVACGMESGINARMPDLNLLDPDRPSFVARAATHVARDVRGGIAKDTRESLELLTKAWNGEWSSIAGVGIQEVIDHFNGQLLSRFNLKRKEDGEFNPKSFSPFLKAFREKATALLQVWLGKNGNSYALNLANGDHYPIFNDTPFNQLANFLIPDCMPMKGLFISICNAGPINNYLANKLDEMAIAYLLNLYASFHKEDAAVKDVVAADILNGLRTGADLGHQAAKQIYQAAMTDYDNYESLPPLTAEEDQKYSPVFTYLQPRLNHFAREVLTSLFLDVTQSVSELVINQGIQVALENPLIINGVKGVALTVGSATGWGVGGMAGGFVGGYSGSYTGFGVGGALGYKLGATFGGKGLGFVGGLVGAPIGTAIGATWGGTIGYWSGAMTGAGTGAAVAAAYAPRLVSHATTSLAHTAKQEVKDQLKLLVDYNIYRLLPLTETEHVLYHLNPHPIPEERTIYASDYARREQLLSQSFAGELIKQFIDLNGDSYLLSTLNGISHGYQLFIDYCLSSKDSTAREILEKAHITDSSSSLPQEGDSERAWRAFVVRTADPSKLTDQDKKLQENLVTFPSYKAKQQYLAQLSAYMNSLSQQDLKTFAENFRSIKTSVAEKEAGIKRIGEVVGDAGNRIAAAHQRKTGQTLSQESIEIIRQSAQALWDTATPAQVDRLVRMLEDGNLTLDAHSVDADYLKNTLERYVQEKDLAYINQYENRGRFEMLKKVSLTENLEDADVVDLLRTLDQIGESLPQETKDLLSRMSDEKEDSVAQAKRHELGLIKDKYESLLSAQFKVLFIRAFDANFKGVVEEIGRKALNSELSVSGETLSAKIVDELGQNPSYDRFLEEMGTLSDSRSQGFFNEASSQIMAQIKGIGESLVREKAGQGAVSSSSSLESLPSSSSWIWWGSSTSSSESSKPQKEAASFVDPKIIEMKVYDQYDIGGFKLKEIINGLKNERSFEGKGLNALDAQDFEKIYEVIQNEKMKVLSDGDQMFLKQYKDEIMQFRMSEKTLENKLFYGYMDVIQDIRNQNKKILDSIQNLKK